MKKADVQVGGIYRVKVSDKLTDVRIDAEHPRGGWQGTNLATSRAIRIKSAQRLRAAVGDEGGDVAPAPESPPPARRGRRRRPAGDEGAPVAKRAGLLDAAAGVLAEAEEPMSCPQMVETILQRGLWETKGATPSATLSSAILREIKGKGEAARFRKVERGRFVAVGGGGGAA